MNPYLEFLIRGYFARKSPSLTVARSCRHCLRPKSRHMNKQCLFMETEYEPFGRRRTHDLLRAKDQALTDALVAGRFDELTMTTYREVRSFHGR